MAQENNWESNNRYDN